ncbi:ferredoxin-thioredoxin reductase catalytic domain-containing protein [Archaeoglobus neptunius]|uniref:ferredoxin-thioredoxin reductase catalytic domain-containing protein n=1 Tax=Archaeoglobus neptunius TaxID=2798580 RepID=UPI0019283E1E|nr:ferredoxin-thioredoxin reductase catalytic domain-containing protein [Archaeoglobus neptunius]
MDVEDYLRIFERVAEKKGWRVNPDRELVADFARGLIENRKRYGMAICPCRLVTGKKEIDRMIICPCVYADDDVREYGRCYCGLYLSRDRDPAASVPDRHAKYYLE